MNLPFSNAVLRLEARITKTYLTKNGYPSNLWELIKLQEQQPELLLRLWHVAFDPILDVHGDIRHLEKNLHKNPNGKVVHGDIRHLEIATASTVNP